LIINNSLDAFPSEPRPTRRNVPPRAGDRLGLPATPARAKRASKSGDGPGSVAARIFRQSARHAPRRAKAGWVAMVNHGGAGRQARPFSSCPIVDNAACLCHFGSQATPVGRFFIGPASVGRRDGQYRHLHRNDLPQPGISRVCVPEGQFATDSVLEGDGIELVVPRHESRGFLEHPCYRERCVGPSENAIEAELVLVAVPIPPHDLAASVEAYLACKSGDSLGDCKAVAFVADPVGPNITDVSLTIQYLPRASSLLTTLRVAFFANSHRRVIVRWQERRSERNRSSCCRPQASPSDGQKLVTA
jgi:hypothetical protein